MKAIANDDCSKTIAKWCSISCCTFRNYFRRYKCLCSSRKIEECIAHKIFPIRKSHFHYIFLTCTKPIGFVSHFVSGAGLLYLILRFVSIITNLHTRHIPRIQKISCNLDIESQECNGTFFHASSTLKRYPRILCTLQCCWLESIGLPPPIDSKNYNDETWSSPRD